jgi:hypothetical protein
MFILESCGASLVDRIPGTNHPMTPQSNPEERRTQLHYFVNQKARVAMDFPKQHL